MPNWATGHLSCKKRVSSKERKLIDNRRVDGINSLTMHAYLLKHQNTRPSPEYGSRQRASSREGYSSHWSFIARHSNDADAWDIYSTTYRTALSRHRTPSRRDSKFTWKIQLHCRFIARHISNPEACDMYATRISLLLSKVLFLMFSMSSHTIQRDHSKTKSNSHTFCRLYLHDR